MVKKGYKRLGSIRDVQKFLANTINRLNCGELEPTVASRLGYLSNILIGALKDGDLERRIVALEELAREREK